jgi:hypothetical protein
MMRSHTLDNASHSGADKSLESGKTKTNRFIMLNGVMWMFAVAKRSTLRPHNGSG